MPHITIDYPADTAALFDVRGLVVRLHDTAVATGVFPLGGIRTWARPAEFAMVGTGEAENAFIRVDIRIAPGRTEETKQTLVAALFAAAESHLAMHFAGPFALQLELSEFVPALTMSRNTMIPGQDP